ncbi:MFS transporter [Aspergillus mulundensis]|uniref:Major facilitator superfamily (MFS) profile domain-containing protein n=1 Tax=Aspergillus mulundensis TaxID=1810919 RepID=A0A3D8T3A8_9EURO|nr:hypothetical protein DSM5745_00367 [Aspergillus mulundensis]RDW93045.1 hypothetical protein DSM5745_00367 [Aspergillus mulundensis]
MSDSASTSETTPLLPPSPPPSKVNEKNNKHVFYTCLLTLFVINSGASMSIPPTTSILQDLLCERHYAAESHGTLSVADLDCKIEPVQSSLSMLRGMLGLMTLLPGLFLGVPYAALAERWGVKRVLLLCVTGIVLGETWTDLVCWGGTVWKWPLQLMYLAPVAYFIGGGPAVGGPLLFVLVADHSPVELRATRFFLMEAGSYSGTVLGFMASSAIMDAHLWGAVVMGWALVVTSFFLTLLFQQDRAVVRDSEDQGDDHVAATPAPEAKSTLATVRTAMGLFREQTGLLVLLFGFVLRYLGDEVMVLLIIYAAQAFGWSFSESGYLVSLQNATHLAVLLLLPAVSRLLTRTQTREQRESETGLSKHFALARGSALFAAVGSAGMALSRSPVFFVISLILYGLSSGYSQSIRSILTLATPEEHRAITYSVLGIMEAAGALIGAPFWPLMYQVGLRMGARGSGFWVGLPFVISAVLMGIVWVSVYVGRVRAV